MRVVALLLFLPTLAAAQTATLGPSLTVMAPNSGTHAGSCLRPAHVGALGLQGSYPIARRSVSLQIAARGYWLQPPFGCLEALVVPPPPADGTHDFEQRLYIQANAFLTTDARIGFTTPHKIALLSGGAGMAWREGRDVPYLLIALGVPAIDGTSHRFGLHIEYNWFLITNDRVRQTWQGGQLISEQSLGSVKQWQPALTFGVRWGLPL